jgi:DNA-directed RNA polymerase subunit RPC12/RpoP
MMQKCTKCGQQYNEIEPEPYLCPPCLLERRQVAQQVDAQFVGRVSVQSRTPLQEYDEAPKVHGFMRA